MRRIVIGVGNQSRGDDGAGLEVAKRVRTRGSYQMAGGSYQMIDVWEGAEDVVVVDAARSGSMAGTVHRFEAHAEPLPGGVLATSTHSIGVVDAIEMARSLGRLPERLVVYGIEIEDVTPGSGLTPRVERAVDQVVREIDGA
ncbi:MAG TPA: hydrogenase maturation protease [Acidimicrobiia bacterium]|nr:hydrogenase maturation protease [Acidimicrobiia bacterium]